MLTILMLVSGLAAFAAMADGGGSLGDRVKSAVDILFGPSTGPSAAAPRGPGVWLRYTTLSKFVSEAEVNGYTLGELFAKYSADLGGVTIGTNTSLRDTHATDGGPVEPGDSPEVGRTYIATVRKEDKGL